jgi:hypothetical protein
VLTGAELEEAYGDGHYAAYYAPRRSGNTERTREPVA